MAGFSLANHGSGGGGRSGHYVGLEALIKAEKATARGMVDFTRATKDAAESARMFAAASSRSPAPASTSTSTSAAPSTSGGATVSTAVGSSEGTGLLANRLRDAVRAAEAPLVAFGAHIDTIFDRVAGTIIEGMRRVDSNTKFPTFDGAITRIKHGFGDAFRLGFGLAKRGGQEAVGSVASLERAVRELTVTFKGIGPAIQPAALIVNEMVGSTAKATAGASAMARVWARIKGLAPPAVVVPPAGQRPGRGRAIPVGARPAPVPRNPPPQSLPTRGYAAASAAASGAARMTGLLAQALEKVAIDADRAFGILTLRGTIAGKVIRAFSTSLVIFPVFAPIALAAAAAGAARAFTGVGQAVYRTRFFLSSLGDVAGKTFSKLFGGTSLASTAVGGLGKALIRIGSLGTLGRAATDAGKLRTGLASVSPAAAGATEGIKGLGREIAVALGIFGVIYKLTSALKDFAVGGIKGASDLNEATSAAEITFGKFTGTVTTQAAAMAKAYGISQKAQIEVASGFGEMAKGAGQSREEAAAFANTFTKLAADFNSRSNLAGGFEEAASKIQSALAGQAEPLRRYGVNLTEANVDAYALATGLAKSKDAISDQAKMSARAALIQRGLSSATGDLARTSDSAANQFRKAGGGVANFGVTIGQVLLPAVTLAATAFNDLLATVVEVFEGNLPLIQSWGAAATGAMEGVGVAVRNMGGMFTIGGLKAKEFAFNTLSWLEVLPTNFNRFAEYLGNNWVKLLADAFNRVVAVFQNAGTYIGEYIYSLMEMLQDPTKGFTPPKWDGFFAGFKAQADALPEMLRPPLMSMQKEIDAEWAKIQAKEDKRNATLKKVAAAPPELDPIAGLDKDGKTKRHKKTDAFAELAEKDSKEAYTAIVRHQFGGKDGDAGRTADNTAKIARAAEKTNRLLEKNGPAGNNNAITFDVLGLF